MDRRNFLKRFGLGAVGAVVATKVTLELVKEAPVVKTLKPEPVIGKGWLKQIEEQGNTFTLYTDKNGKKAFDDAVKAMFPLTPEEAFHTEHCDLVDVMTKQLIDSKV